MPTRAPQFVARFDQLDASCAPLPMPGRLLSQLPRLLLPAAMLLSSLLFGAGLSGCASTQSGVPVETGEIGPGGRLGSRGSSDDGLAWSILVGESDIDLSVGDTSVVLRGYGSRERVLYQQRHTNPPEFAFTIRDRPDIWWCGYTLKIGSEVHELTEALVYVVTPDGVLHSE